MLRERRRGGRVGGGDGCLPLLRRGSLGARVPGRAARLAALTSFASLEHGAASLMYEARCARRPGTLRASAAHTPPPPIRPPHLRRDSGGLRRTRRGRLRASGRPNALRRANALHRPNAFTAERTLMPEPCVDDRSMRSIISRPSSPMHVHRASRHCDATSADRPCTPTCKSPSAAQSDSSHASGITRSGRRWRGGGDVCGAEQRSLGLGARSALRTTDLRRTV